MSDLVLLGVFLLVGFAIREICKPIQKLFIPASIIGGVIALLVGQQVFGWVTIPDSFGEVPGVLIGLVMTGLLFGVSMNVRQVRSYLDYSAVSLAVIGIQIALGLGLGILLSRVWTGMPEGWGLMGVFSFFGGHGTAGAAGAVFEDLGVPGNLQIGMILSTIGMVVGIVGGMVIVNLGVRRNWAEYVSHAKSRPSWTYGGRIPEGEHKIMGHEKVTASSMNGLALQLCWLLLAMFIGGLLFDAAALVFPVADQFPAMIHGMIGALILWPLLKLIKADHYVDKRTINNISGFALELIIVAAIATLSLELAATYFVPLMIFTVVMIAVTTVVVLFFFRRFSKEHWFEKSMMCWGSDTGNTSVGLALLRAVDPDTRSNAAEAHGVFSGVTFWVNFFPAILPMLLVQSVGIPMTIGLALGIIPLVLGWLFLTSKGKVAPKPSVKV